MLQSEMSEREAAFGEAARSLRNQIEHWSRPGIFVVPDTSACFNANQLDIWDVGAVLDSHETPIHLLFPMVVIDELDRLKESSNKETRKRAGLALAILDRKLAHSTVGVLRDAQSGDIVRGQVTVEIVGDPPRHSRLPIADDEIVDRALAIQALAGRDVILITYDTGQSHRARMAGLQERKLTRPPEA